MRIFVYLIVRSGLTKQLQSMRWNRPKLGELRHLVLLRLSENFRSSVADPESGSKDPSHFNWSRSEPETFSSNPEPAGNFFGWFYISIIWSCPINFTAAIYCAVLCAPWKKHLCRLVLVKSKIWCPSWICISRYGIRIHMRNRIQGEKFGM